MQFSRKKIAALTLVSAALPWGATASDQEAAYPQRPVTLVIGYPPGGGADALARLLAQSMGESLGQKMIVQYKPGAAGNIGAEYVARTPPDGYTVFLGGRPNTIHKTMYERMKYDFSRDLVPVGLVATMPFIMVSGTHAPMATVQDLVRLAKTYPSALTCASDGVGTTSHLLCELLQQDMDIDMQHVPYHGAASALTDVMGGRVDITIVDVASAVSNIQAGKLRPIAVMSGMRVPEVPYVPTMEDAGIPGFDLGAWCGLVVPAGTPAHVIVKLNQAINEAVADPALRDAMAKMSFATPPQPNTPTAFKELIAEETDRWTAILRSRNIKPLH